jgi:hypothetical protein
MNNFNDEGREFKTFFYANHRFGEPLFWTESTLLTPKLEDSELLVFRNIIF